MFREAEGVAEAEQRRTNRLSRRTLLVRTASVVLAAPAVAGLLAACSQAPAQPTSAPAQQAPAQATAPAAAQPTTGGASAPAAAAQPTTPPAPAAAAAPAQAAPGSNAARKVRFLPTHGSLADWAPYVGLENKYFQDEGLDVSSTTVPNPGALTNAIISGQGDFGPSSIPTSVTAAMNNAPMKLCCATQMALPTGKYNNWWCVLPDSPIEKPADLRGKKVHIFSSNSLAQVSTRAILRKVNLVPGDYEELSFPFDQAYTAIKTGQADIALFIEPFYTAGNQKAQSEYGQPLRGVYTYLDLFPNGLHLAGMMGNTNFMAGNQDATRAFLRAQLRSAKWGMDNPDATKQIIAKWAEVPYDTIKDMILAQHSTDGKWMPGFMDQLQQLMISEKMIDGFTTPFPESKLVETAYLPSA